MGGGLATEHVLMGAGGIVEKFGFRLSASLALAVICCMLTMMFTKSSVSEIADGLEGS